MRHEICTRCGKPCTARLVDFGLGLTEAWGVTMSHSDYRALSWCCDAEVEDQGPEWWESEYELDVDEP